jgi:cytochrome c-type biogenesis protein CcmH/NrfF
VLLYSVNESYDVYNWSVPGSSAYMVYWVNPSLENVTVAYVFNLIAPPASPWTALIWIVPAGVVVALVSIRLFRWAARKPPPHATKKAPPGPDTEEPSDPRS